MKLKISVIIPVYNVEKYIEKCIISVLNQTYKNLEVIIVNDGTEDNSMERIEYLKKDFRVKIINKKNGGLSSARNEGINIATGDYLFFLDSDDWLEKEAIEILCRNLKDEDIVFSNFMYYNEIHDKKKKEKYKYIYSKEVKAGKYFLVNGQGVQAWNKLYKREFILKNDLKFIEGIIYEDLEFNIRAFFLSSKVKYIDENLYNYRVDRSGSIMSNQSKKIQRSINSIIKIEDNFFRFMSSINSEDSFIKNRLTLELIRLEIWRKNLQKIIIEKNNWVDIEKKIINIYKSTNTEKEKEIIKWEIRSILCYPNIKGISLITSFYWKNKIINLKLLKRKYL